MLKGQTLSFSQETRIEAIAFWSMNSYQHIDILLKSVANQGVTIYPVFEQSLEVLSVTFQRIAKDIKNGPTHNHPVLTREFLLKNRQFIHLVERLNFENFNGYPLLYETVLHFLYEAKYADGTMQGTNSMPLLGPQSVLYHIKFRERGFGHNDLECIYGQMYFWLVIGAQHPSLLMNVTAKETVPQVIKNKFTYFVTRFNDINYELSNLYPKLNRDSILEIHCTYEKVYVEFFSFLMDIKENDLLLHESLKNSLPPIFFDVLDHIIDEAEDAIAIGKKIQHHLS